MEDVITDAPPPSRFYPEDLNSFAPPPPLLPSPFLLFSSPKPDKPLRPALLIIAISKPSLFLFHHVSTKTLIGSFILPEIPLSKNADQTSPGDKSCHIYALNKDTLLVSVQIPVPAERSHLVSKLLIGEQIVPERVLILDTIQSRNFWGKLPPDEAFAYKLETSSERKRSLGDDVYELSSRMMSLDYFPSGSLIDGLAAALLASCELKNVRATLCVSWPEIGSSVTLLLKSLLHEDVLRGLESSANIDIERGCLKFAWVKDRLAGSEMYI